ncbi:hypothetical protein BKP45_04540 [Anaerobacillus alkalidiazotrophicus]|uniref:Sporulation protein n=1 Tax=Anaerobacillus alkalidiazotrophicus TaxID=472963 RepID=A0A1S2MB18_9BACI|nr:YhcN/YlaJ family sporulation lipoprotein [Anaerobacillus alkalidiazotrophicus]OIJ21952.1 hypothetical protein BKP45_04540 [Anaerobacillus alkalidiazotrophicus]
MKKIAITLSAATILMGALVGCGVGQDGARGLGGGDQRGFGYHTTEERAGFTGQRAGEGPITDMFTRDDRRGARGLGRDGRHPATGLAGERGMTGPGRGVGAGAGGVGIGAGQGAGLGMRGTGAGGVGIGAGQGAGLGMRGTGAGDVGIGAGQGAGLGVRGHGGGFGGFGTGYGTGVGQGAGLGVRGHGTGFGGAGTGYTPGMGHGPGFGGAGVVGDREGYVDDRGILRGRGTTGRQGVGGLGQTGRTEMGGFAYPHGYDTATVQRISGKVADVENVRDSRVIVHENKIIVGVDANGQDTKRIEKDVRQSVGDLADDKEVIVVTDRGQFDQVRTADDRLRAGEPLEEVGATINEMFRDFGRAIQRPFERTR